MSSLLLGYDNQVDGATLTGGSWNSSTYARSMLQDYRLSRPARTLDALATSTKVRFALAAPAYVGLVGLMATNATVEATYRLKLFSDSGFTTSVYDSGTVDLYPMGTIPFGDIPWGAPNWWTGRPLAAEIARFQRNIVHPLSVAQYAQYGELAVTDTSNPDSYLQAGRLFVGQAFRPTYGLQAGKAAISLSPRTTIQRARDGTPYFQEERADLSVAFSLDALTDSEAMRALDLQALADLHGEVYVAWDTSRPAYAFRRQVFGRLARLNPIEHPSFALRSAAFQVEGLI